MEKEKSIRGKKGSALNPLVRGAYKVSQVEDIRSNMSVGDIVIVNRPMASDSGALNFHNVKVKVLAKYDHYFLVEDAEPFKELCFSSEHKRRWSVRYEDLLSLSIRWHERNKVLSLR